MHGINVKNKGFSSLTDYVRVRYSSTASKMVSKSGETVGWKVYWDGVSITGETSSDMELLGVDTYWVKCNTWGLTAGVKSTMKVITLRETEGATKFPETDKLTTSWFVKDQSNKHLLFF